MASDCLDTSRYTVDERTRASLDTWMRNESTRPDILIIAPTIRDVGEQQLVAELADAVYQLGGFRDLRRRHVMSRNFPALGTDLDYQRFLDQAFEVSEITDEFFGVDSIDLSSWIDADEESDDTWRILVSHISSHPETDFVFRVYTDSRDRAMALARRILQDTGIALETVELSLPTAEQLAGEFLAHGKGEFNELESDILARFVSLREENKAMNYGFARSIAAYALHLLSLSDEKRDVVEDAFEHYRQLTAVSTRNRPVGF